VHDEPTPTPSHDDGVQVVLSTADDGAKPGKQIVKDDAKDSATTEPVAEESPEGAVDATRQEATPGPKRRRKASGPTIVDTSQAAVVEKVSDPAPAAASSASSFELPPFDLLEPGTDERLVIDEELQAYLNENAAQLVTTLNYYGVKGQIREIQPGPTVTTYEMEPEAGTKVSKIAGLADDLAMNLGCQVRIIAPIPGKKRVGFEVPNRTRKTVNLRELIEDRRFQELKAPLPVVLGRDIVGAPFYADLASMPHVLVAGATGAGKSVGINVMLVSLLYRRTPDDLRLLMVDPKVVELQAFDRMPHMLLPVVTDMRQAANALKWAVDEMERRYQLLANAGTKNIKTYNAWVEKVHRGEVRGYEQPKTTITTAPDGSIVELGPEKDPVKLPEKMPYIVIVIDEFADLMMQQGKDVEASIARLAQKARAAGMHVILATQRPSVDVITGMIKANFPTRIAFKVTQRIDSRTILDEQGAEHLLGRGDMLVKINGVNETKRVQCPFVSEEEVEAVTAFLRRQGEPTYDESILRARDENGDGGPEEDAEQDPKYDEAVQIVAETRRCSTSWLQRKLGIGYNRAAKIVEMMEKRGLVGPAQGAKDREVLIDAL
jgi:S-DNA-T family DNA segregation ATPase FtsK/SpoIIIE